MKDKLKPCPFNEQNKAKFDFISFQLKMILEQRTFQPKVKCWCLRKIPVWKAYRCLYCGEYFCEKCAEGHFGESKEEHERKKRIVSSLVQKKIICSRRPQCPITK